MGTRVAAFVAVVGTASLGCAPAYAQIGDAGQTGRASGTLHAPSRGDDCRDYGRRHGWDYRGRDCDERYRNGRNDRRDGRWDDRRDDRIVERIEWRYRNDRSHRALLQRLDRTHDQWHRRHGWAPRDRRRVREHEELHRRLDRMHYEWHRRDHRHAW